jgi:chromatin remodeling complex protein RSC6
MVRTTKSEKTATAPENTVVKAKKTTKKDSTPVEEVKPTEPETAVEESSEVTVLNKLTEFNAKMLQLSNLFSSLKTDFKTLEKSVTRELKNAAKKSGKKRKVSTNRAPSGFVKPTIISDELATFLGKAKGSEMARTEVSKEINQYIRTKQLQDKENGRKIHPDAPLTKLLNIGKGEELTYFNLQRYMKHHFPKSQAAQSV